ncbi:MAG TPA: hybrid sensor histidine kinase/response regulator [Polyangiaceae bacterium]|nr:hybrid sensor histidine kinase/response regulator [Polyangiaceae bacterium]
MTEGARRKGLVLVVDDNQQNRALARATLEQEDFEVVVAESGEQALRCFSERTPDCVLLDVRMPGMDGPETCRRLRLLPEGQDVPIVFLTALRDVETFESALTAGGDDFVTKPVQPTELVLRVQAAFKMRRLDATNKENFELLRRQRDDLMRLTLQKERLSSFVVHDLKNPVSTVDLLAQLLQRDKTLSPEARETANAIRVEVSSLMRLILNLLDISRSEEGALSISTTTFDLAGLASTVVDTMQVRAHARQVLLESRVEAVQVSADVDLMRRVLENLVDNALRHSPKGSTVALGVRRHSEAIELRISDQGRGIPVEMRESIFARFVQGERQDTAVSRTGRGLGLTFCRLAVEAHGGHIYVEDGEPGAVFCVRLPLVR